MTTAQWIYIGLLLTYGTLFLVFARMFYWKHYAQKHFYDQRPIGLSESLVNSLCHEQDREIPRFSIFVPARSEADVIERTIDHLSCLRYSPDHYELIVVTDEKEVQAAIAERIQLKSSLLAFLERESPWQESGQAEQVLMALLARLALEEAQLAERKVGPSLSIREIHSLPPHHRHEILREIALRLLTQRGHANRHQLCEAIRRSLPQATAAEISRLYPIFLSFAIPTVMASIQLKRAHPERLIARMMSQAIQARQPLTQKVLTALSETVSSRILRRIQNAPSERLAQWLTNACAEAIPTTQEIVERKRHEFAKRRNLPAFKHVVVPWDFNGDMDGLCTGQLVPSTKGRALNYAFRYADPRAELWAFYDAESRPDRETLLYVAWKRLTAGPAFQIAQGPVYQIRNFWKTGPLCKIAGLYQAVSHEWQIPYLLRSIPFIGGTNIFVSRDLMLRIGGFDNTVLTEDMELGARAWLKGGAWPDFLPYASSEQTPPTFKAFFRQRLRWGSGYLQVYDKIKADSSLPSAQKNRLLRTYWWKGHFTWPLFQMVALLPIVVAILRFNKMIDVTAVPFYLSGIVWLLGPFYLLFTIYCFFHYFQHMDHASRQTRIAGFAQLLALPISAFFLPVPYSSALLLKWLGKAPQGWVKTPRTKE